MNTLMMEISTLIPTERLFALTAKSETELMNLARTATSREEAWTYVVAMWKRSEMQAETLRDAGLQEEAEEVLDRAEKSCWIAGEIIEERFRGLPMVPCRASGSGEPLPVVMR